MTGTRTLRNLIAELADKRCPIPPLPAQAVRTTLWLLAVVIPVSVLYTTSHRVSLEPATVLSSYLWAATLGSAATAALAALAAFELSQPQRPVWWLLLPLPVLTLWLGAAGLGCRGTLFAPDSWGAVAPEALDCLFFITGTATPLSIGLAALIRWTDPARPVLVGAVGGVAVAAAAATLLALVHPHNAALLDVLAHGLAITLVVAATTGLAARRSGGRITAP